MVGTERTLWKRLTGVFTNPKSSGHGQNLSEKSRVARRRVRQVVLSIPHYLKELARMHRPSEVGGWAYFKFPYLFPLRDFPTYLSIEVTNKCNYSCKHCWRTAKRRPEGEMDVALFEKIVREVSLHKTVRMLKLLGGGEAALHPRFGELMEIAARYAMPTVVYTNGSLFNMYQPREILSWGLDTIVLAVDGLDAHSHERFKIGSNYASLQRHATDFYKRRKASGCRNPFIEIRHVIVPNETVSQLLQFKRTWLESGDSIKFQNLEPATSLYEFSDPSRPKCRSIRREVGIWWDGTLPMCPGYWRESLGNVSHATISELWQHPTIVNMRQFHERRDFAQVPVCLSCRTCT